MTKPKTKRSVLAVRGLCVQRHEQSVLKSLHWKVEQGQHWVILGANGSGKTTLLKALCGYMVASSGEFEVLGKTYGEADWRMVRGKVGLVSASLQASVPDHEPALHTVVSGRTAELDLWRDPSVGDAARARRCLAKVGASLIAGRAWGVLSQGERQRVLLARALMARPSLLILDEPCAGLDPVAREDFLRDLQSLLLNRRGPAVVLVTHHVEEICPGFTHGMLLRGGQKLTAGILSQVMTSELLSLAFGAAIKVKKSGGRYGLSVFTGRP